ncbi:hypothetical protein [Paenibacillus wynnii]|uniref:hypothetical protein n=1 Tax=Paenibacillus wynnii TaxID=268407 RepID=UPI00278FCAE1|nr:hypothetical protein [Paenibacillus wynnii]MDQ0192200.1 hypothetical protein [Paenibacillus wynnii]
MKPIYKITAATLLMSIGIWAGSILNITADGASVSTQPGTADDPVVTKSYVDQQIQKALQGGAVSTPTPTVTPAPTQTPGSGPSSSDAVVIVDVKPGQTLIASAGAEFIVRAGKAIIYSNDANGVADLTDGKDLTNGQVAPSNHLLSYPRDGRGISVQNGQTLGLTVMVRGGYTLQ